MPNKSKKSSNASARKKPSQNNKLQLADNSPRRLHLLQRLDESMQLLQKVLAGVPPKMWHDKPSPEHWSVGEHVHHLILIEVLRLDLIKGMLAGTKESLPARAGPPPDIAGFRTSPHKNQAHKEMVPKPDIPVKILRAALLRTRNETTVFARIVDLQKAASVWLNTVSLGVVNAVEFLEYVSEHMERHADHITRLITQVK
jgi:hypothetical protein